MANLCLFRIYAIKVPPTISPSKLLVYEVRKEFIGQCIVNKYKCDIERVNRRQLTIYVRGSSEFVDVQQVEIVSAGSWWQSGLVDIVSTGQQAVDAESSCWYAERRSWWRYASLLVVITVKRPRSQRSAADASAAVTGKHGELTHQDPAVTASTASKNTRPNGASFDVTESRIHQRLSSPDHEW